MPCTDEQEKFHRFNSVGQSVLKFSQQFVSRIAEMKSSGYELKAAKVNFIVHRTKEETGQEARVILPELFFERMLPV